MYAIFIALFALVTACSPRYADFFPYYDNGTKKPSLTMLSVFNETNNPLVADFPKDMTKAIRNRLKRTGKVFSPPLVMAQKDLVDATDLKTYNRFKNTDFVVMIETVGCEVLPYKRGAFKPLYIADIKEREAKVLSIAMRLKIVNLKGKEPKVARMELIKSHHMISQADLDRAENGDLAALEMVRSRIARDLANKVEETVCVKK